MFRPSFTSSLRFQGCSRCANEGLGVPVARWLPLGLDAFDGLHYLDLVFHCLLFEVSLPVADFLHLGLHLVEGGVDGG